VPPYFGLPIPFNPAFPVYGGKVFKTGIVAGCDCPGNTGESSVYADQIQEDINEVMFDPNNFTSKGDCLCPEIICTPQNQYYGYSQSDTFILQCKYNIACGNIIPVL